MAFAISYQSFYSPFVHYVGVFLVFSPTVVACVPVKVACILFFNKLCDRSPLLNRNRLRKLADSIAVAQWIVLHNLAVAWQR